MGLCACTDQLYSGASRPLNGRTTIVPYRINGWCRNDHGGVGLEQQDSAIRAQPKIDAGVVQSQFFSDTQQGADTRHTHRGLHIL